MNPVIYHGTPLTPRAALEEIGEGRAFCVSHWRPDSLEVVEAISPAIMFRQRRIFGMAGGVEAWRRMVHSRRLDALLSVAGTAIIPSWTMGGDTGCARRAITAQRRFTARLAVWPERRTALAHGRADQSPASTVREIRPGMYWLDRGWRGQGRRLRSLVSQDGRTGFASGEPLARTAHDARCCGRARVSLWQRRCVIGCAEWLAL